MAEIGFLEMQNASANSIFKNCPEFLYDVLRFRKSAHASWRGQNLSLHQSNGLQIRVETREMI